MENYTRDTGDRTFVFQLSDVLVCIDWWYWVVLVLDCIVLYLAGLILGIGAWERVDIVVYSLNIGLYLNT